MLQDQRCGVAFKRYLQSSVAPLGLLAFLASGSMDAGLAQTVAQAGNKPDSLGPIVVSPPQRKPMRRTDPGAQRSQTPARVAGRPRPQTAVVVPATTDGRATQTPLDTNVVTEVGSQLGLTARQTPATVEVIDKQVIEDRGLRTTTDVAKAATGVIGGDAPGAPAIFSMRGFAGDQINTLYNDIWIGPSTMTGRPMDTANLERVEILKGPASLLSGIGATGGAVNYVTKLRTPGRSSTKPSQGSIRSKATVLGMVPAVAHWSTGWIIASTSPIQTMLASSTIPIPGSAMFRAN